MKPHIILAIGHGVAMVLHLAALITVSALFSSRSSSYSSWRVSVEWDVGLMSPIPTGVTVKDGFDVVPFALLIFIEAVTFLFHLGMFIFALVVKPPPSHIMIKTGINWMRWVTYSMSASAMFVLIAFWMGTVQLLEFVTLVGLIVSMMIMGALAEALHAQNSVAGYAGLSKANTLFCGCGFRRLDLVAYFVGMVPFAFAWAIPYSYFAAMDKTGMPSFVNWIIATQFILFVFFPAWMAIHLFDVIPKNRGLWMEIGYTTLSATAKIVLVGLVAGPAAAP